MLSYVMVGTNDLASSGRFYTAVLAPLGYERKDEADAVVFFRRGMPDQPDSAATVYVKKPYDGRKATVGNGSMLAFRAETQEMVRILHAAGLAAGGSDEGSPGFRAAYSDRFYVGYLRDPLGNKIALFCTNPAEGTRGS